MLRRLRQLIPRERRGNYHRSLAWLADVWYGHPSRKLIVVGVTGTDGKTTTAAMITAILQAAGQRTGLSSTVWFQVADRRWLNETHMTMPGRFHLQRWLRDLVRANCRYAVIEVSSEGLAQHRLDRVDVDVAVLTNLTPEHIEAHGSFDAYRAAKGRLFAAVMRHPAKRVSEQTVPRAIVVNTDDDHASFFYAFPADHKIGFSLSSSDNAVGTGLIIERAENFQLDKDNTTFSWQGQKFSVPLPAKYNLYNALAAAVTTRALGISLEHIAAGLATMPHVPGRWHEIDAGQSRRVVIDYAVTPAALRLFYGALRQAGAKRIIAVFGATGGGRDKWKRPELGQIAGELADYIILTAEDPFDEDPTAIAEAIKKGITTNAPTEIIADRRVAIKRALEIAQSGDVIALTGMGSETTMNVAGGKRVEWNDNKVVESLLS